MKGVEGQKIRCKVKASPSPDVTWLKDDTALDMTRYSLDADGIKLPRATDDLDKGTFTILAMVVEVGGLETRTISVEVHSRPVITQIEKQVEAVEGDAAELRCSASAVPYATYSWTDGANRNLSFTSG